MYIKVLCGACSNILFVLYRWRMSLEWTTFTALIPLTRWSLAQSEQFYLRCDRVLLKSSFTLIFIKLLYIHVSSNDNIFTGDKVTYMYVFTINYLHSDNCTRFGYLTTNHELTVQCLTFLDSSTEYLALSGRTIYKSLKEADSKAIW